MVFFRQKNKLLRASLFALFLFCFTFLILSQPLMAADTANKAALDILDSTAKKAQLIESAASATTAYDMIGMIINILLGFLGVVFLILIIYGGITWMTAGGNEEKVKKTISLITQATIGLAIILAAFLLTNFVIFKVIEVAQ